jgi:hypothetical protein
LTSKAHRFRWALLSVSRTVEIPRRWRMPPLRNRDLRPLPKEGAAVKHHVDEEESHVLPELENAVDRETLLRLTRDEPSQARRERG